MNNTLRFVVMGDTHYVQPESHYRALNGHPGGVTEYADITRNYWMTRHVLPKVISGIAALQPDFVIQTGDIMQGHCDEVSGGLREMGEALQMLDGLSAPLYFALGTHDGTVAGTVRNRSCSWCTRPLAGRLEPDRSQKGTIPLKKSRIAVYHIGLYGVCLK